MINQINELRFDQCSKTAFSVMPKDKKYPAAGRYNGLPMADFFMAKDNDEIAMINTGEFLAGIKRLSPAMPDKQGRLYDHCGDGGKPEGGYCPPPGNDAVFPNSRIRLVARLGPAPVVVLS